MRILSETTLLEEITIEWEFEYGSDIYTIREYEGLSGHQVWFNGEEIEDLDEIILDEMSGYEVLEYIKEEARKRSI